MPLVDVATQSSLVGFVDAATQTSPADLVAQPTSQPATVSARPEKMPMPKWDIGGKKYRRMFPLFILPKELNPRFTQFNRLEEFPLVWFGVPWDRRKVMNYACSRGYGVRANSSDKLFDFLLTWGNFTRTFKSKWGVHITLQEVWGHDERHILTFHSNRDLHFFSKRKREFLFKVIEDMEFRTAESQWYLDRYEAV